MCQQALDNCVLLIYNPLMSELGKARHLQRIEKQRLHRLEIWLQFVAGASLTQLATKYHVSKQAISNLVRRAEKDQYAKA